MHMQIGHAVFPKKVMQIELSKTQPEVDLGQFIGIKQFSYLLIFMLLIILLYFSYLTVPLSYLVKE